MKRKTNQKNLIITMLIVLLLALAVGYAALSDVLTISGTANAKGTFNLEFQNAEVVKNVGADTNKTTAVISEDKNTLTVNVADLSYPGSGVEFSVDIVNVGTIPAEVQAVTPTNITGSDKIKVTGLDVIKTDHPKIEAGDKCNIHFTVEWPADSGEILENESSISFGLQIEYTQSTGALFEGNSSHTDTDKNGNTVNTNTTPEGEEIIPNPTPTKIPLISQITPQDYGRSINYKCTVKNNMKNTNQEVSNWKLLYKDDNNIYIILDDFLSVHLVPEATGLSTALEYMICSDISREALLNGLRTKSYWSEFANGYEGAEAQGTPNYEMIMKSHNEKHETDLYTDPSIKTIYTFYDSLYFLNSAVDGVNQYWLSDEYPREGDSFFIWDVQCDGTLFYNGYNRSGQPTGIRPVVSLPSSVTGSIAIEPIQIDEI